MDLGLLQREVALRIGVDKTAIYNWEAGKTCPNLHAFRGAIRFLGHNPAETGSTLSERLRSAWLR